MTLDELVQGFDHLETLPELAERLKQGRPLRVKLGLDPTTPDLHLGHAVVLGRLQRFVEAGHEVTLVIGDFTARIGDPSGRNEARPALTDERIAENMKTYAAQAGKVVDLARISLRYNSEWLAPLTLDGLIRLLSHVTVAQMLKREDFAKRFASGVPISLHEFLYPIAQAYDSVALKSDIELGGNDQLFNLLMGRHFQTVFDQPPQICMTVPLLEGLDGTKKMSKSTGNYIGLTDTPQDQFGKTMRLPDELIGRWSSLVLGESDAQTSEMIRRIESGDGHPMDEKKRLGEAIVRRYHGDAAAVKAKADFESVVQRGETPGTLAELPADIGVKLDALIVLAGFADSKRAAQRLITGGAVKIDGSQVTDATWVLPPATIVLSVGNRRYVRVLPQRAI